MKIYLAGPINGRSLDECIKQWYRKHSRLRNVGYIILNPFATKRVSDGKGQAVCKDAHAMVSRDRWMVTQADIVYADLSNATIVSIGTIMEIAWASLLGKQVVLVMEEGNIHTHSFVHEAATLIFQTSEEAEQYLIELHRDAHSIIIL